MERFEIRLCGFGGQGIVLAGYILGKASTIYDHKYATFTQSHGPEARGGACSAQVVISDKPVRYPYIIKPSVLIAMSQEAYSKYHKEVTKGGLIIFDEDLVRPDSSPEGVKLLGVPGTRIAEEKLGRKMVANVVMLGFFAAVTDVISLEALREAVRTSVPKGTEELNLQAFELGYQYAQERIKG